MLESKTILITYTEEFVMLSGDNNPMHTNSTLSRRLMFGKPVIHGIYSVLLLIDAFHKYNNINDRIIYLKVKFLKPIFDNDKCQIKFLKSEDGYEIRGLVDLETKLSVFIKLSKDIKENNLQFRNSCPRLKSPEFINPKTILGSSFKLDLFLNKTKFVKLFPNLSNKLNFNLFSVLLASTRSVGVYCPGANSLYSELLVSESNIQVSGFNLNVSKHYKSINLVKMQFEAINFTGMINSFFRQSPKKQIEYKRIKEIVKREDFFEEKVLIIGGSRGLGETAAKILAAFGAQVTITYARGKNDAKSIVDEISESSGYCRMMELDIKKISEINLKQLGVYDSIFYFATPFISSNNKENFNTEIYQLFNDFYIKGFRDIYNIADTKGVLKIFYPSTTFIEEQPLDFKEYTLSKFKGELVCKSLNKRPKGPQIFYPRLPKMSTDQTSGIYGDFGSDEFPVLLKEINKFYN